MIRTSIFAMLAAAMTFAAEGVNITVNARVDSHIASVSVKSGNKTLGPVSGNGSVTWSGWEVDTVYTPTFTGIATGYEGRWSVSTNDVVALSGGTNKTITMPDYRPYQGNTIQGFHNCQLLFYGEPKQYTVTLDRQSGSGGSSSVIATNTMAMPLITPPTRLYYTFGGYYTEPDGVGTKYYNADGTSARNWDILENTTLHAKWTAISHSVTFDPRGGTLLNGWTQSTNYLEVSGLTLPTAADIERADYAFAGWYDNDALVGNPKTEITPGTKVDMRFYAKWAEKTYDVAFNSNGGLGKGSQNGVSMIDTFQLKTFASLARDNGFQAPTGYSFASWNTAADGSGSSFGDGAYIYSSLTNVANTTVTLYAQWSPNPYEVAFQPSGADGGETMANQTFTYDVTQELDHVAFTYTGRAFKGWSTVSNNPTLFYPDGAEVANLATGGVVNLYANWTNNVYTVAFDANGGTGAMDPITCTYTVPTNLPYCTFVRDGWGFKGWTNSLAEGVLFADHARVTNLTTAAEVTLLACWTGATYSVVLDARDTRGNGVMTNGEGELTFVLTNDYVVGDAWNLPAPTNVDEHLSFAGWTYVNAQGVITAVPAEVPPPSVGATNLVAAWSWVTDDLAAAVDAPELAFSTFGTYGNTAKPGEVSAYDADWFVQTNFVHGSTNAVQSGALPVNTNDGKLYVSWLTTTVEGKGVLSFWWKCDAKPLAEAYTQSGWCGDTFKFGIFDPADGITNEVAQLTEHEDWCEVVYTNESETAVSFAWAFVYTDYNENNGGGTGWVDRVTWKAEGSAGEATTAHGVAYSWLREKLGASATATEEELEALAEGASPNGKAWPNGTPVKVWEDYWAGTDPNDPNDLFRALIAVNDGVPFISWQPDLSVTGDPVRVYHVLCSPMPSASAQDWVAWPGPGDSGAATNRFFKVELDWEESRKK